MSGTRQHHNPMERDFREIQRINEKLSHIRNKILVLSGKGGVGKSTVSANLAIGLAKKGFKTGLLDIDVHGPSIPKILGLESKQVSATESGMKPVLYEDLLKVISIGLLIGNNDDAVIWRGPLKYSVIKQFIRDVDWGDLDYLVVDSPPGTGDEPLSIAQLIGPSAQALIVTTPQDLSIADVRRSIQFCRKLGLSILGVVENMSGFVCPHCGATVDIFKSGGGEKMAKEMNIPFLGKVPLDPTVVVSGDAGGYVMDNPDSPAAGAFEKILETIADTGQSGRVTGDGSDKEASTLQEKSDSDIKIIALPVESGRVSAHFGHCETFALFKVDPKENRILETRHLTPPPHEPGVLPNWLKQQNADVIISGGMGVKAQQLFRDNGIEVIVGVSGGSPEDVARQYVNGTLNAGDNLCDH